MVDLEARPGIAEEVAESVINVLCPGPKPRFRVDVGAIGEMVSELVHNFAVHSERPLAAFVMQWYPRVNRLNLAIADCGIGIRQSLASNPLYASLRMRPHHEAALKAFEAGVSRSQTGGGTGLWDVRETVRRLGGGLRLATGRSYVAMVPGDPRMWYGPMAFELPGVQVEVWIPGSRRDTDDDGDGGSKGP